MDAPTPRPELKSGSSQNSRVRYVRLAIVWLGVLLALGLWQAYGAWLFSGGTSDVY